MFTSHLQDKNKQKLLFSSILEIILILVLGFLLFFMVPSTYFLLLL